MPPSSDTRLMSIRYGMVKRDSVTAKANCAGVGCWRSKPPDSAQVSGQAATISATVKTSSTGNSTASTRAAKSIAAARPAAGSSAAPAFWLNSGMNAAENAPSANSARNMLGRRNATKNASDANPAPT